MFNNNRNGSNSSSSNNGVDITDSAGNGVLNGTNYNDTLYGDTNGTPDTLIGGGGNDTFYVYNPNEIFEDSGSSNTDTIYIFDNPNVGVINYNMSNNQDTSNLNIVIEGHTVDNYSYYYDTAYEPYEIVRNGNGTKTTYYQEYITSKGGSVMVYGNPMGWGNPDVTVLPVYNNANIGTVTPYYTQQPDKLDYFQGDNNKGYYSDCGIASCENILIECGLLAQDTSHTPSPGQNYGPGNDLQESYLVKRVVQNNLCEVVTSGSNPAFNSGGTSILGQVEILKNEGLSANYALINLTQLAQYIQNNDAVIAEVDADELWFGKVVVKE